MAQTTASIDRFDLPSCHYNPTQAVTTTKRVYKSPIGCLYDLTPVSTRYGSIPESIRARRTGLLVGLTRYIDMMWLS